jgi:hypothetical protein
MPFSLSVQRDRIFLAREDFQPRPVLNDSKLVYGRTLYKSDPLNISTVDINLLTASNPLMENNRRVCEIIMEEGSSESNASNTLPLEILHMIICHVSSNDVGQLKLGSFSCIHYCKIS